MEAGRKRQHADPYPDNREPERFRSVDRLVPIHVEKCGYSGSADNELRVMDSFLAGPL